MGVFVFLDPGTTALGDVVFDVTGISVHVGNVTE
jgi:hypothetical protein